MQVTVKSDERKNQATTADTTPHSAIDEKTSAELSHAAAKVLLADFGSLALPNHPPAAMASISANRILGRATENHESRLLYEAIAPVAKQIAQLCKDDGVAGISREDLRELSENAVDAQLQLKLGGPLTPDEIEVVEIGRKISTNLSSLAISLGGIEAEHNDAVELKNIFTALKSSLAVREQLISTNQLSPDKRSALGEFSAVADAVCGAIELGDLGLARKKLSEGVNAVNQAFGEEVFALPKLERLPTSSSINHASAHLHDGLAELVKAAVTKEKFREATHFGSLSTALGDVEGLSEATAKNFQVLVDAHARALLEENKSSSSLTVGDVKILLNTLGRIDGGAVSEDRLVDVFRAAMKVSTVSAIDFSNVSNFRQFSERFEAAVSQEQKMLSEHEADKKLLVAAGTLSGPTLGSVLENSRAQLGSSYAPLKQALAQLQKAGLTLEVTAFDGFCRFSDRNGRVVQGITVDGLVSVAGSKPVFTDFGADALKVEIEKLLQQR